MTVISAGIFLSYLLLFVNAVVVSLKHVWRIHVLKCEGIRVERPKAKCLWRGFPLSQWGGVQRERSCAHPQKIYNFCRGK